MAESTQTVRVRVELDLDEVRLERLVVRPGEALVLRVPANTSGEVLAGINQRMKSWQERHGLTWPILVLADDVGLAVVSEGEAAPIA